MTQRELQDVRAAVDRWRQRHCTAAARRAAYLEAIPQQVAASIAFEGEPVDQAMLAEHLQAILAPCRRATSKP